MPVLKWSAALAALIVSAPFAMAQENNCTAQIEEVQNVMSERGTETDDGMNRVSTILAEAGEASLQGNEERCLELVRQAKDMLNIRD